LEERSTGFEEVTNGYREILLLHATINPKNETLCGSAGGNDAASALSLLFFNFKRGS
jgi:hypothetical protein